MITFGLQHIRLLLSSTSGFWKKDIFNLWFRLLEENSKLQITDLRGTLEL